MFRFDGAGTVTVQGLYVQDSIALDQLTINLGLRADRYVGIGTSASALEPRAGVSYAVARTATMVRASYGRTLETPYNENLVLSSSTGPGGLSNAFGGFGDLAADTRAHGDRRPAGARRLALLRRRLLLEADDERLRLRRAARYPDRVPHRVAEVADRRAVGARHPRPPRRLQRLHGVRPHDRPVLRAGNRRAALQLAALLGRVPHDHDEKFEQTTNLQYEWLRPIGGWVALTWRYDSGLVAGHVPDYATALTLTGDRNRPRSASIAAARSPRPRRRSPPAGPPPGAPRGWSSRPTAPRTTTRTRRASRRGTCSTWASAPTTCGTPDASG